MLLDEWERSGGSAAQFAGYVGIKYSTLANWIQKGRKQARPKDALVKTPKGGEDLPKVNGRWVEAVVEKESEPKAQESSLRVYFKSRGLLSN
jgi:hypothetical protein